MEHAPLDYVPTEKPSWDLMAAFYGGMGFVVGVVATLLAIAAVSVVWGLIWATQARAHDAPKSVAMPLGWTYPWSCCSDKDCKQATDAEVREVVRGYLVTASGEIVPYGDKRIKDSPDGLFHTCQVAGDFKAGRVLCLFVPPRGF